MNRYVENIATFDELIELVITDQIKWKMLSEIKEHFTEELLKIKEVDVLVEKLDDFEMALKGLKIVKLHKVKTDWSRGKRQPTKFLQNTQWNSIRQAERAINSKMISYSWNLPGHVSPNVQIEIKCTHRSIIVIRLWKQIRMIHRKET